MLELYTEKINLKKTASPSRKVKKIDIIENCNNFDIYKGDIHLATVSSKNFDVLEQLENDSVKFRSSSYYTKFLKEEIEKPFFQKILHALPKCPSLFSLILKNKYYNADHDFYVKNKTLLCDEVCSPLFSEEDILEIHKKCNGEFSESLKTLREETSKIFDYKQFKPFEFFVNSIYNIPINKKLRGISLSKEDLEDENNKDDHSEVVENFFLDEIVLELISIKINKLFLCKLPKTTLPLIVRRSLSHDFFEKIELPLSDSVKESSLKINKAEAIYSKKILPIEGIIERGLTSTSLYIHPGFTYNQRRKNINPTPLTKSWLMILVIPPGVPALDTNNYFNNKFEKEILLPNNLEYTIYDVIKDYKIESKEAYERVFLNKFTLWPTEYKRRLECDKKELNDTFDIFFAYVTNII